MAFDVDPKKMGTTIGDVPIHSMDDLEEQLADDQISVAILTVPAPVAQMITDRLVKSNIKGILNFTPARLNVPPSIRVHHIDLAIELQALVYFLKHYSVPEISEEEESDNRRIIRYEHLFTN